MDNRLVTGDTQFSQRKAMKLAIRSARTLLLLFLASCSTPKPATLGQTSAPITFALIGDVPYTEQDAKVSFPTMIQEINRSHVAFTVHDGDIKHDSLPCTELEL